MIQVTMHAALIAAIRDIQMNAKWQAQRQRSLVHLGDKTHFDSETLATSLMGVSETSKIPCCESSSTNCSASRAATAGSTSNSWHRRCETISDNGVRPSAACQITVATSFKVKNVESLADMIIISPPSIRAAMAELFAIYFCATRFSLLSKQTL